MPTSTRSSGSADAFWPYLAVALLIIGIVGAVVIGLASRYP